MEVLIIFLLTLINGIFSMSEIALVSSRRFKLESQAKKGNHGAAKALELSLAPNKFLSTVQIGITLIGILLGIYGGETLTNDVRTIIEKVPVLVPYARTISVSLVLLFITFMSIIFGELLPKRIGLTYPEAISSFVSRPMSFISMLTAPFVWLLTSTNDLLLRLLGIQAQTDGIVSEEEIKSIIQESTESGEIQEIEQDIVERVFAMGDRKVGALMTHRSDLVWFDIADDLDTLRQKAATEMHSAYPVSDGDFDNVKGIVFARELFTHREKTIDLNQYLRQPLFVPITASAYRLLEDFKQQKIHYALVADEYGTVQGMITMDDIMDALVGDSSEVSQEEYSIQDLNNGTWMADGQFPFFEFVRYFEIEHVQDDNAEFNTLGGFLANELHRIPAVSDKLEWLDFKLEVKEMDGRRVDKILITRV